MGPTDSQDPSLPTHESGAELSSRPLDPPQAENSQEAHVESPIPHEPPPEPELTAEEKALADSYDVAAESAVSQAQAGIEIDYGSDTTSEAGSASDAGYETDSIYSASTSISSSARDFAFENGRRYHKFREGAYNFPNDPSEQDREDMKHAMMVNLLGGRLHFAPLRENPGNVLDMGTGTGIWAIEMGDLYPSANILGVDLSPIQPDWVPPNVRFMVDDVESPWLKPLNYYDYIHSRHTVMAIRDWPLLMKRALEHLKPGGWMEMQEIHHHPYCSDNSMPPDHPVAHYWILIHEALAALGVNFNATLLLEDMMRDAGFINVTTKLFHVPIGTWPKNKVLKMVGLYWRTILMDGLQPIALGPMTRGLKWSPAQVEVWLVEVRKAYMDNWVHSHMPLHIICGQKPGGDDRGGMPPAS